VHENLKCQEIVILQEVIFKLVSVHDVVIHFQHDAFEHLVYIDHVGVDTTKFVMHTSYLGSIHGVGAFWDDGDGSRIERLYPGRC
jgi:hypothetical protein